MKILRTVSLLFSIAYAIFSLSSCSQSTTNTVYVHDTLAVHDTLPDWDDSTWNLRPSGTSSNLIALQFLDSTTGFAGGAGGTIIRTTNAGLTWTSLTPAPTTGNSGGGDYAYGLWFFNKTSGIVVGDANGVQHTSDGGTSWYGTTISSSDFLRSVFFLNPMVGFVGTSDPGSAGHGGEIWKTTDAGVTWQMVSSNNTGGIYSIKFGSSSNGVALGTAGTAYWTSDGGSSWHAGTTDLNKQILSCAFLSSTEAYAVAAQGQFDGAIIHTMDAGVTWSTVRTTNNGCRSIAFNGASVLTVVGNNGTTLESTDKGATWKADTTSIQDPQAIAYPSKVRAVMVGNQGQVATRHREY